MTWLEGKTIVMTGAGRGIGAATARLAASYGARVVVNDRDAAEAEAVASAICEAGGTAVAHPADITDWAAARELVMRAVAEWGRLDGLFNNAGLFRMARIEELDEASVRAHLEVNVLGSFACATHAARQMLAQGGGGAILNVSSGAQMGLPAMSAYGASKGAMASATYAWATELREAGIRVNALSPMAATRMMDEAERYLGAPVSSVPAEFNAPVACYLLSDAAQDVTGQVVRIEGRVLSLAVHPGIALPTLEGEWDFETVAEAFRTDLGRRQFPSGTVGMTVEIGGNASRTWD